MPSKPDRGQIVTLLLVGRSRLGALVVGGLDFLFDIDFCPGIVPSLPKAIPVTVPLFALTPPVAAVSAALAVAADLFANNPWGSSPDISLPNLGSASATK